MIYEACTIVAEHLKGAMGVNMLAASVPVDPLDPPLEQVTVESEFEISWLPGTPLPATAYADGPLVLVRRADDLGEFSAPGYPEVLSDHTRLGLAVMVFFPRRELRKPHLENRCLSALLRATRRSLGMLFEDVALGDRALRHVQLSSLLTPIRLQPTLFRISETDVLAGALHLDIKAIDRWAEGIAA